MKLLNSFVSPFAARIRIAIYAYGMPVEVAPSGMWGPDYVKAPEFLAINPIGKVPVLLLDDGGVLPESGVIVEHLADAFPGNGLRPEAPGSSAKARLLAHILEVYVQMRAGPLFGQIFAPGRDPDVIRDCVAALDEGLSFLEHYWDDAAFGPQDRPTLADCAAVPFLFFFGDRMVRAFGMPPIIDGHPRVAAYWERAQASPPVQRILSEMREAIGKSPMRMLVADQEGSTLDRVVAAART